ncbi:MAG: 1-deoxy-D-xylulose-5-phosphate reductoisomerase [Acidimicrobiia bacterium]|nr:1-deoxy-D-xylulose-5-phosphate reductoisomerase [Acidimicrobiia bacterium]
MTRPLVVLGATGSIGRQALDVAEHLGAPVHAIVARAPSQALADLGRRFPDARVVATGGSLSERREVTEALGARAEFGTDAMLDSVRVPGTIVVNGIVGAAGLRASVAALEAGNRLALANKETLVVGGAVVLDALARGGGEIVPVDSEHSALFQLLLDSGPAERLILTASGGPFRGQERADLEDVTPTQALAHPTWVMGRRISIDSATMANKGLEVIEAHFLFGLPYESIEVVVHPQSTVHSLVVLGDGSFLAHLGATDMRIPIQYAITHPERSVTPVEPFSLEGLTLGFESVDRSVFRALDLAYAAGGLGGSAPAVFNAADEVAVEAFLQGRLGFLGIAEIIERALESHEWSRPSGVEEVVAIDERARTLAASLVAGVC